MKKLALAVILLSTTSQAEHIIEFNIGALEEDFHGHVKLLEIGNDKTYVNPEGTIVQTNYETGTSEAILDKKNRTLTRLIGDKSKLNPWYTYTFDSKGCPIKYTSALDPQHPTIYKCDDKNRVIEQRDGNSMFGIVKITSWSSDGLSYTTKSKLNDITDSFTVGRYNLQGDEIYYKNTDYNTDGSIKYESESTRNYTYDNQGNWITERMMATSKSPGEKPKTTKNVTIRKITYYK